MTGQCCRRAGSTARLEDESTYRGNYKQHALERRAPPPPAQLYKNPAAFDGTTTSHTAYVAHPIEPRMARGPGFYIT